MRNRSRRYGAALMAMVGAQLMSADLLAQDSEPMPEGEVPVWQTLPKPRGYVRTEFRQHTPNLYHRYDDSSDTWVEAGSPYLTQDLVPYAVHDGYVEANTEVKFAPNAYFTAYTDFSMIYNTLGPTTTSFEVLAAQALALSGESFELDLTQVPQALPIKREAERLLINELYVNGYVGDHLLLLAGKRRTYWGGAFTWTPMDMLNPAPNALDSSSQREGLYSLMADASFDRFTFSMIYAPFELDTVRGLPANWDFTRGHYAARLYLNPWFHDVNLVYVMNDDVYSNRARHRAGGSYSGYPIGNIEIHAEFNAQVGRTEYLVQRRDAETAYAELEAPYAITQKDLNDGKVYGDFLLGSRYAFADSSILILEYYFRSGGYKPEEYELYREYVSYLETTIPQFDTLLGSIPGSDGQEVPAELQDDVDVLTESWSSMLANSPFLFQNAFMRRHYLSAGYQKSWIADRISPTMNVVLGLEDLTVILYPQVQVQMTEKLHLFLGGLWIMGPEGSQGEMFPDRRMFNFRLTARY